MCSNTYSMLLIGLSILAHLQQKVKDKDKFIIGELFLLAHDLFYPCIAFGFFFFFKVGVCLVLLEFRYVQSNSFLKCLSIAFNEDVKCALTTVALAAVLSYLVPVVYVFFLYLPEVFFGFRLRTVIDIMLLNLDMIEIDELPLRTQFNEGDEFVIEDLDVWL